MASRRTVLWLVMFALVAAQALGLMHRVLHVPHAAHSVAGVQATLTQAVNAGGLASLFNGHTDDSTCRLYDQLGHGDAMPSVPALALPLVIPAFLFQSFQGDFVARWAALFDARGPPCVR